MKLIVTDRGPLEQIAPAGWLCFR